MLATGFELQAEGQVTNYGALEQGRIVGAVEEMIPFLAWEVLGNHQVLEMHQVA